MVGVIGFSIAIFLHSILNLSREHFSVKRVAMIGDLVSLDNDSV